MRRRCDWMLQSVAAGSRGFNAVGERGAMLSTLEDVIIVVITVVCAQLMLLALNRVWPSQKREVHNDLIGWQLGVLGTTYAVIIGFMLYTVWTNFGAAELNADNEANSLTNIYRLAAGLPEEERG